MPLRCLNSQGMMSPVLGNLPINAIVFGTRGSAARTLDALFPRRAEDLATGRPSYNLDTWAMAPATLGDLVARHPADIAIAEGVMGLFDGVAAAGQTARGATADLAALLGWPVLLVLDVSGQTETAAAVAAGLAYYRDDVAVAGGIPNRFE